jgi:hypothetical protein
MDKSTEGFERKLRLVATIWLHFVSSDVSVEAARVAHAQLKAWLLACEGALYPVQRNEEE